jgi:thiamine-monophosphate kinase
MAHLAPKAMIHLGTQLIAGKLASAMMDVSDGLSIDLQRICEASCVGAVVHPEGLPGCPVRILSHELQRNCTLHGGEDYALLFTVPQEKVLQLGYLMKRHADIPITRIGQIIRKKGVFLRKGSSLVALPALGYDHFSIKELGLV